MAVKKKTKKNSKMKSVSKARQAPKKVAKKKVSPVPTGYTTVTPHLVLRGAAKAIDFYKKAFGAKERMRMGGPDGNIGHAELQIGNAIVMCADESPQMGSSAPETVGGSPVHIFLYVPDVDKIFGQAVQAGAKVDMPLTDMFWGDRYGKVTDPFGHHWSMATHVEDVSPKEMERRAAAWATEQK